MEGTQRTHLAVRSRLAEFYFCRAANYARQHGAVGWPHAALDAPMQRPPKLKGKGNPPRASNRAVSDRGQRQRLWLAGAAGVVVVGIGGGGWHWRQHAAGVRPEARRRCRTPSLLFCASEMCSLTPPGLPGSHVGSPVPRPWSALVRDQVYSYHDDHLIQEYTKVRLAHQKQEMAAVGKKRLNATFSGLVEDGMTFNEIGLDLTLLQHVRHRDSPGAVLQAIAYLV